MKKLILAGVVTVVAFELCASFGPLSPSAKPYEREYIWPEDRMP